MAESLSQIQESKKRLRKELLDLRAEMTKEEVKLKSGKIMATLIEFVKEAKPKVVMSYLPYGNEVDTGALHKYCFEQGIKIAVPVVRDAAASLMDACLLLPGQVDFVKTKFGVLEPRQAKVIDPGEIDLVIVPGVGFDRLGGRLGHGKGFYDRYLQGLSAKAMLVGVGYDLQLVEAVPVDGYDKLLASMVTESGFWGKNQ